MPNTTDSFNNIDFGVEEFDTNTNASDISPKTKIKESEHIGQEIQNIPDNSQDQNNGFSSTSGDYFGGDNVGMENTNNNTTFDNVNTGFDFGSNDNSVPDMTGVGEVIVGNTNNEEGTEENNTDWMNEQWNSDDDNVNPDNMMNNNVMDGLTFGEEIGGNNDDGNIDKNRGDGGGVSDMGSYGNDNDGILTTGGFSQRHIEPLATGYDNIPAPTNDVYRRTHQILDIGAFKNVDTNGVIDSLLINYNIKYGSLRFSLFSKTTGKSVRKTTINLNYINGIIIRDYIVTNTEKRNSENSESILIQEPIENQTAFDSSSDYRPNDTRILMKELQLHIQTTTMDNQVYSFIFTEESVKVLLSIIEFANTEGLMLAGQYLISNEIKTM